MQFRKIAALAGSAVMAGATLAGAALAATVNSVGEITTKLGTPENMPVFVVGANAAAQDVAAAIDIAVRLAANSKTSEPVQVAAAEVSVTGGKMLETDTSKLYYKSYLNDAVKVLTANDMDVLASGTVEDENGKQYNYEQYVRVGPKQIVFGDPVTTDTTKEAVYYIALGTTPTVDSDYLVQAEVFLDNALNVTKAKGKKITLFGQEFTISYESTPTKLVLYKSAEKVKIDKILGSQTFSIGGETYTATLQGFVDPNTAVLKINDITKSVGVGPATFGNLNIYVEQVLYYETKTDTGETVKVGRIEFSVGADKVVFQNGQPVKVGNEETAVKGTMVSTDYNGYEFSYLKIAFDAADSQSAFIRAGETWTDPVFGTIKVAFNGLNSAETEDIKVEPASTNGYRVVFTDKGGNGVSLEWAYDTTLGDGTSALLQDSSQNVYNVVEGGAAGINDYTFLAAAPGFERIVQVTGINAVNSTSGANNDKGTVTLKDVVTGTEFVVNVNEDSSTAGVFEGKKVIDGQDYYVYLDTKGDTNTTNDEVKITWDAGASAGNVGDEITVYPILRTSKGAEVVLSEPVTLTFSPGDTKTVKLPTGDVSVNVTSDGNVTVKVGDTQIIQTAGSDATETAAVGSVEYNFTATPDSSAPKLDITLKTTDKPALMVIEEKDANGAQNAVIVSVKGDVTDGSSLDLATPVLTGTDSGPVATGDNEDKTVDVYGTVVYRTNTNTQDSIVITYPETQLKAAVAVGSNPQFGKATSKVTTEKVVPVTTDIAKLDTEVDDTMKQNYDLIVVGGPCVNKVAAELLGDATVYQSHPACDNLFAQVAGENAAIVKVFPDKYAEGKTAVLVAGWNRDATKKAAMMLQSGGLDGYTSEGVKIVDSSVEELTVAPAENVTAQ